MIQSRPREELCRQDVISELCRALARADATLCGRAMHQFRAGPASNLDHGRADIAIEDPRFPGVAVQASFDPAAADRAARSKLSRRTTTSNRNVLAALAVHIPSACRRLSVAELGARFREGSQHVAYALHRLDSSQQKHWRWPRHGLIQGTVHDASCLIASARFLHHDEEPRLRRAASVVEEVASMLSAALDEQARREVSDCAGLRSLLGGLRTTVLLWLNASFTQQQLQLQGMGGSPPARSVPSECPNPVEQAEIWQDVARISWRPVFKPAIRSLRVCCDWNCDATTAALGRLTRLSVAVEDLAYCRGTNLGADLLPKLLPDRKKSAAFYTQPATAELLAALTIRRSDRDESDWACPDLLRRTIIADMACGTGALLRAGFLRVLELHERAGGTLETGTELHRGAMEFGLRGTDISPMAVHLTVSRLVAEGRGGNCGMTHIGCVDVGGPSGKTGALEYFSSPGLANQPAPRDGGEREASREASSVEIPHDSVNWVLMNPPYSRTRGGQSAFDLAGLTAEDRKRCQKRWGALVKCEPAQVRAGMAASFLVLAKHKAKPGSGRIGLVLPLTCALADTWQPTRKMIESEFGDIVVVATVSGASLKQVGFSVDTGMEEMLLVATRHHHPTESSRAKLHCATLYEPCTWNGATREIARAVESAASRCQSLRSTCPITVGSTEVGSITVMEAGGDGAPWNMVGVADGRLALAADALTRGRLDCVVSTPISLGLEMGVLEDVFQVGPTHHRLGHVRGAEPIGAFEFRPLAGAAAVADLDCALWRADAKQQRSLRVLPTHAGLAPPGVGSAHDRARMRATASTLFYARNMRWTSQSLLAATTRQPVLGGSTWTGLRHEDSRVRRVFALWWNSTLGMIVHWTQGQRTQSGRSRTQIGALRKIPCPRLDRLSGPALALASSKYEVLQEMTLLPAMNADADPVRKEVDAAVVEVLRAHSSCTASTAQPGGANPLRGQAATDAEIALRELRELWCDEPSVHGWKRS